MDLKEGFIGDAFPSVQVVAGITDYIYLELSPDWETSNESRLNNKVALVLNASPSNIVNGIIDVPLNRAGGSISLTYGTNGYSSYLGNTIGDLYRFARWNPDGLYGRFLKIRLDGLNYSAIPSGALRIRVTPFDIPTANDESYEKTYTF